MKHKLCPLCLVTIGLMSYLSACSRKAEPADVSQPLQRPLLTADAPVQRAISAATANLKVGNPLEAARALAPVTANPKLTEEHRQVVGVALRQANQAIAADPGLNTKEMHEDRTKLLQAGVANAI